MHWEAWFTLAVIAFVLYIMLRGIAPPDMALWGGTVLVTLFGIVEPEVAMAGFTNPAVLTVGALFVVAAAMYHTGALDQIGGRMLGSARTERSALTRLFGAVVPMSAFLNNTAVVAMLIPIINDWCRKHSLSPSRLLLPLSYLSILGGMCTLIGTSTNLIVGGLMSDQGMRSLSMFELAWVGVPAALIGGAYLTFVAGRLLPQRQDGLPSTGRAMREYLVDMLVKPNCPLIGKRVEAAGLRHLPGLFLIEITRLDGRVIAPVTPDQVVLEGDRLTFAGVVTTIVDLERIPDLVPAADENYETTAEARRSRRYCEAVISGTSPMIGRNIREANFRARYNAAIIAVHRGRVRLTGRIGDIILREGDTLLIQAGAHFVEANRNNPDFYLVSRLDEARPVRHERTTLAFGLLLVLVLLLSLGQVLHISTAIAAFFVAGLMVITRCISPADARQAVKLDVLLTITAAFGLAGALQESEAAAMVAHWVVIETAGLGPTATLAAIYGLTIVFTTAITNNATAILMFPIAMAAAHELNLDPRPFAIVVAAAASASFASPIAYQTNMMVFGPGGYKFRDYLRVGVPLNILLWIIAVLVIPRIWGLALPDSAP